MKRYKLKNRRIWIISIFTGALIMTFSVLAAHGAPSKEDTALSEMISDGTDDILKIHGAGETKTDEYRGIISELVSKLDSIEQLSAGTGAVYDLWTDPVRDPSNGKVTAALVSDRRFSSVSDIRSFMKSALTDNAIKLRYSDVIDCSDPLFFERGGSLYVDISRTKGCMGFLSGNLTEIHEIDADTFTAVLDQTDCFAKRITTLRIIKSDSGWKIDDISTADK